MSLTEKISEKILGQQVKDLCLLLANRLKDEDLPVLKKGINKLCLCYWTGGLITGILVCLLVIFL